MVATNRVLALLAACLATALVLLSVFAAPYATGAADALLDAPRVGTPAQGDAVHYRFGEGSFAFRWDGTASRVDAFGAPVAVDLAVGALDWGSGRPLVFEAAYPAGAAPLTYSWTLGNDAQPQEDVLGTYRWDGAYVSFGDFPNAEACLVRAGWQGMRIDDIIGRGLDGLCPGLAAEPGEGHAFVDHGMDRVQGVDARVLEAEALTRHATLTMRLWLVDGLAYPARAHLVETQYNGYVNERTLDLVGFEPGHAPLVAPPAPVTPTVRPGATFGETGLWGIVEGDPAAYPFAPSEAIATFRDPIQFSGLRDYLATHPDARVVEYSLYEDHSTRQAGGVRPWIWRFTFNDPAGEAWIVEARKATHVGGPAPLAIPVPLVTGVDLGPRTLPPLDPATYPEMALAGSDVLALWALERAPTEGEANWLWGFFQPDIAESTGWHGVDPFLRVGRRDVALQPARTGIVQDQTVATWRDIIPATGAVSSDSGGRFGDAYGFARLEGDAPEGWSVPAPVESARALRNVAFPAAAGLLAGALVLWSPERNLRVALLLFSRLARGEVLDHPRRAALLDAIREEPGVHGAQLAKRLGMGNGALLYHLAVLERERIVAPVQDGRARRYFAAGSLARDEMLRKSVLRTPSFRRMHDIIRASPGISLKDAAACAGLTPPAAHHAVARLIEAGLVRRARDGRKVELHPEHVEPPRFA